MKRFFFFIVIVVIVACFIAAAWTNVCGERDFITLGPCQDSARWFWTAFIILFGSAAFAAVEDHL